MTSNVGGDIKGEGLGFNPVGQKSQTEAALRRRFTPEFLGRIDNIICFHPLDSQSVQGILRKYLKQLEQRVGQAGVQLFLSETVPEGLEKLVKPKTDARQLRRLVQDQVEGPMAVYLLRSNRKIGKLKAFWEEDRIRFQ